MRIAVIAVAVLALAGCKSSMVHKGTPDEFAITKSAPLIVPPDFALTPPKPGQARAVGADGQGQAIEALFGPGAKAPPKSPGEQSLLDAAGAVKTDPAVRSTAGDKGTATVDKGAFLLELLNARPGTTNAAVATVTVGG